MSDQKDGEDTSDQTQYVLVGEEVEVSGRTSLPGQGLTYPSFTGTMLEESPIGTWDVVDVRNNTTGEVVSVYSFSLSKKS